jgi:hypothetical protein
MKKRERCRESNNKIIEKKIERIKVKKRERKSWESNGKVWNNGKKKSKK